MKLLIISIMVYLILGICYAINYFHDEYENTVEDEGVLVGLLWPMFIVMFAVENLRGYR